jgi:hypothetical protein
MVPNGGLQNYDDQNMDSPPYDILDAFPKKDELLQADLLEKIKEKTVSMLELLEDEYGSDYYLRIDDILSDYVGEKLSCNDCFALFAIHTSLYVSQNFLKEILIFLGLFRKVLNKKGWEILKDQNPGSSFDESQEYCEDSSSAEYAPDSSNQFVLVHFPEFIKDGVLKNPNANTLLLGLDIERLMRVILLINNWCQWLQTHKFSDAKVIINKCNSD